MTEWELARYLIDAKKDIDTLLFIKLYYDKISNLDLKEKVNNIQMDFYIKLCVILDNIINKREKKKICEDNKITISPEIVKYERKIIDYIVLHQYCHLKYKIHSKGFIKMLERYEPKYEELEKIIKS